MKAKLLNDAGEIEEGTDVEIVSSSGTNAERTADDSGGQTTTVAPVYAVRDEVGHAEDVDTRDLEPLP